MDYRMALSRVVAMLLLLLTLLAWMEIAKSALGIGPNGVALGCLLIGVISFFTIGGVCDQLAGRR
jgi:hypothetical protein